MKSERTNSWKHHTGNDTIFNGGLIAAGIVGLLLAVIDGPVPGASAPTRPVMLAGLVLSEIAP